MASSKKISVTIRMTVVTVFILATTVTALLAIGLQYYFGHALAKDAASNLYTSASSAIASEMQHISQSTANVVEMLADNPVLKDPLKTEAQRQLFTKAMQQNPLFYGIFVGRGDGSFFEVINLDSSEKARKNLQALPSDQWVLITVEGEGENRIRHFTYMDKMFISMRSRSEKTDFDVLTRPWYVRAMDSNVSQTTDPYIFAQLQEAGQTISKRLGRTETVIGVDMMLSTVSGYLKEQEFSREGEVFIYKGNGQIVASSVDAAEDADRPPITRLKLTPRETEYVRSLPEIRVSNLRDWAPYDFMVSGKPSGYSVDLVRMIAEMTGIKIRFVNGFEWPELVEQFQLREIDMLQGATLTPKVAKWGAVSDPYIGSPYAALTPGKMPAISRVSQLQGKSVAIPAGWSIIPILQSQFPELEIIEAKGSLDAIHLVQEGTADVALDLELILRYLTSQYFITDIKIHAEIDFDSIDIPDTLHLIVHEDKSELMAIINKAIAALDPAQLSYLQRAWLDTEAGKASAGTGIAPKSLINISADSKLQDKLIEVLHHDQPYFAYVAPLSTDGENPSFFGILVPTEAVVGAFMSKVTLSALITGGFLLLLLPFCWVFANPIVRPIRQLAEENDKVRLRHYDSVVHVDSNIKELRELSGSMVDMVASIQAHEIAQRELMDAFIQLIAQAIDDKSAYTGGHCARVPELALMLAEHASASEEAAFSEFKLTGDDEWREYRIAAWLHDCGKITTPEHIVDKGSKLETIYNRIHEVRMRFEVLWRDAHIHYLTELQLHPEDSERLAVTWLAKQEKIQDDFAFVAGCNVGGEFLDQDKLDRLRSIAQQTWQRNFDDRLGLSPPEELRAPVSEFDLPVTEQLLSDKPEHIIERTRSTDYPPDLGINMDVPEHLYNLGEVYNLSISRGTLTNEDRFKINEHMISTIKMLEALPFPPELERVPRYASTHHETMKGSGYPRKLPGDQLSIPERILAVADVFEALTASDRPYKKAKPVSVAVDILHKMVLDNHLDKDCFELFLRNRVYLQYATEYLPTSQIDDVDLEKYGVV
jgi:HD-GYP domain-containing protein (c-di-GMP phosphodiesterase class II)/ABC-type amino acid transport substrate-binding protein